MIAAPWRHLKTLNLRRENQRANIIMDNAIGVCADALDFLFSHSH